MTVSSIPLPLPPLKKGRRYRLSRPVQSSFRWYQEVIYDGRVDGRDAIWVRGTPDTGGTENRILLFGPMIQDIEFHPI